MSPYLEFEGKSVEKAVDKACKEQNIPVEKLKYDVISFGSTGIFGLVGAKKARIRITLPEKKASETETADREVRHNNHKEKTAKEAPARKKETRDSKTHDRDSKIHDRDSKTHDRDSKTHDRDSKVHDRDSKVRDRDSEVHDQDSEAHDQDSKVHDQESKVHDQDSKLKDESLELGRNTLQRIIDFITTDATISVQDDSDRVLFNIEGGNSAVLIGKRGQTLEAIQYLVEKVMNKHSDQRIRIQIDIEGYLDSRRARLRSLASRLSEKAKRTGKPVTIGQLNAHDRRIIHLFLKDDSRVRTQSMGDGFYRKLVIYPKRGSSRRGRY